MLHLLLLFKLYQFGKFQKSFCREFKLVWSPEIEVPEEIRQNESAEAALPDEYRDVKFRRSRFGART